MLLLDRRRVALFLIFAIGWSAIACAFSSTGAERSPRSRARPAQNYEWKRVTEHALFPAGYNFPLFTIQDRLWVLSQEANWYSEDGKTWSRAPLPALGLNTGYQQYVQFKDAIYALGRMKGNYLNLKLGSRIARTSRDFRRWEVIAEKSELPARVFYGALVFDDRIWLIGGFDGRNYYNDVWNSSDGVHWTRVASSCPWAARSNPSVLVFNEKIWLFGGGIIGGQIFGDVWQSSDGSNWHKVNDRITRTPVFGSPIVYDGKIWLVGINRNGTFQSGMLASGDGVNWSEQDAPWTPRGGVAVCVYNGRLFMTGGKYSVTEKGKIRFIYNNDVWCMNPRQKG